MEEKTLLGIALICVLLGIPSLWLFSTMATIEEIPTQFLEEDSTIKITGTITRITQKEDFTLLDVEQKTTIPVLLFDNASFEKGMIIQAEGTVDIYQGKKELLAKEVRKA